MYAVSFRTFIVIKLRTLKIVTILTCVTPMLRQKIDLSNDVSFMKILHVVSDSRHERQYIVFTPRTGFVQKYSTFITKKSDSIFIAKKI